MTIKLWMHQLHNYNFEIDMDPFVLRNYLDSRIRINATAMIVTVEGHLATFIPDSMTSAMYFDEITCTYVEYLEYSCRGVRGQDTTIFIPLVSGNICGRPGIAFEPKKRGTEQEW